MNISDVVGFFSTLILLIPVLKDQYYRFEISRNERRLKHARWKDFPQYLFEGWRAKRDGYSGWDSLFMLSGILGLVVSFLLKILGN